MDYPTTRVMTLLLATWNRVAAPGDLTNARGAQGSKKMPVNNAGSSSAPKSSRKSSFTFFALEQPPSTLLVFDFYKPIFTQWQVGRFDCYRTQRTPPTG